MPVTTLVELSSPAFSYGFLDRARAKDRLRNEDGSDGGERGLPGKIGSLQWFKEGHMSATDFLALHPWPSNALSRQSSSSALAQGNSHSSNALSALALLCGAGRPVQIELAEDGEEEGWGWMEDVNATYFFRFDHCEAEIV